MTVPGSGAAAPALRKGWRSAESHDRKGVIGSEERHPTKVLFLTSCTGRGGAGHSFFYLLRYLDRDQIEPVAIMPTEGVIGKKLQAHNIETIFSPRLRERFHEMRFTRKTPISRVLSYGWNIWDGLIFLRQLIGIIKRHDIELIYCNQMMVKITGILAGLVTRRPVIIHCRTIYGNSLERLLYGSFAALPHVRRIIAVSRASAANFRRLEHKVDVVPNGIPLPQEGLSPTLRRQFNIDTSTSIVGFVGRVVQWKGINVFLQAAEEILSLRDDIVFVVVGDLPIGSTNGTLADYIRRVKQKGFDKRIVFTGFTDDIGAYLKDFNLLIVPSVNPDPCPRTVIEAMAFGIPVIGSAIGGIPETIEHEHTGILVEPGNVAAIRTQVLRVLDDGALRARLASHGREAVAQRFGAERVSRRIQQIIMEETRCTKTDGA